MPATPRATTRAPEPSAWTTITWSCRQSATTGMANEAPSGDHSRWLRAYWSKKGRTWSTKTSETANDPVRADRSRLDVDEREPQLHGRRGRGRRRSVVEMSAARAALATLSSPGAGTPIAAIVLPSGAQKKARTVPPSRVLHPARRAHPSAGADRPAEPTSRPGSAGATNARSFEPAPNSTAAIPNTSTACESVRSRVSSTICCRVPSPAATNARKRPSLETAGARKAPARMAAGSVATPSGRDLAEEAGDALAAAVDEQPGRVRPRPVHRRAFADGGRGCARVGRDDAQRQAVGLGRQERQRVPIGRPVEVERRVIRRCGRRSRGSAAVGPGLRRREDVDRGLVADARRGRRSACRPATRPGTRSRHRRPP